MVRKDHGKAQEPTRAVFRFIALYNHRVRHLAHALVAFIGWRHSFRRRACCQWRVFGIRTSPLGLPR
jgi:hypothetical protein